MMTAQRTAQLIAETVEQIDQLQIWFAAKPYGWRERATADQIQQWADRELEQDWLITRLEMLRG